MNSSRVLEKIGRKESCFATALHLADPTVFELTASLGFDAIWLDLEHHSFGEATAQELIRAARAGGPTDIVVRPGKGEFMRMGRLLEAGAHGIMYPRCESPAEAANVVRWAKFAPIGQRGFDGAGADSNFMGRPMVDYLQWSNANTFVILQIEDDPALGQCEEIIAVPGVDMIMLGPADYSVLIGVPGQIHHPAVVAAQKRVAEAAKGAGKHWAATSASLDHARSLVEMGASLVFNGADIVFVRSGLAALQKSFAALAAGEPCESVLPDSSNGEDAAMTCAGGIQGVRTPS